MGRGPRNETRMPKHEPEVTAAQANAYRLRKAIELIEALCIVDPDTGEQVPLYEPDPTKPGSYRRTERSLAIESRTDER
jgi:hypothetical protein